MKRMVIVVCILSGIALIAASKLSLGDASDTAAHILSVLGDRPAAYRIVGLQVGTASRAARNLFIKDRSLPPAIEVSFAFWVLKTTDRLILVDTGFVNRAMIAKWQIIQYRDPVAALRAAGFEKEAVTDIVITHTHWDHIGGLLQFGDTALHLTHEAFRRFQKDPNTEFGKRIARAHAKGLLHVSVRPARIAPGVAVVPTGLHTKDFQYVVVRNLDGIYVIASDIAPLYANFERNKATGQTSDPAKTLAVQETMKTLVQGDLTHILPGHEPSLFTSGAQVDIPFHHGATAEASQADPVSNNPRDSASCGK